MAKVSQNHRATTGAGPNKQPELIFRFPHYRLETEHEIQRHDTRKMALTKRSTHWSINLGCVLMCTCTSTPFNNRLWAPAITTSRYSLGPKYRHSSPHAYPSRSCTFIFGTEVKCSVRCRRLTKVCWRRRPLVMWPYTYTMSNCLHNPEPKRQLTGISRITLLIMPNNELETR